MSALRKEADAEADDIVGSFADLIKDDPRNDLRRDIADAIVAAARTHAEKAVRSIVTAHVWHCGPCVFLGRDSLESVAERFGTMKEARKHLGLLVADALARADEEPEMQRTGERLLMTQSTPQKYVDRAIKIRENWCGHDMPEVGDGLDANGNCTECVADTMTADIAAALHEAAKDAVRGCFKVTSDGHGESRLLHSFAASRFDDRWMPDAAVRARLEEIVEELTRG